jgi:hypothetical protein
LLQLLGRLGLNIGYAQPELEVAAHCRAGLEWELTDPNAPYVVKNPRLCDELDALLARREVHIDHVLIPVRDLYSAAESRRDVVRRVGAAPGDRVIGGIWPGTDAARQEDVLARKLYSLIVAVARHNLPHTFLEFPRLARDSEYLIDRLSPVFRRVKHRVSQRRFARDFAELSRPEWIHDFAPAMP